MAPEVRPRKTVLSYADVDWGADEHAAKLRSRQFDDIYFSDDGLAETEHVFINGNALRARFATVRSFTIAELGFGTGLNILAAWRAWRETSKPSGARLHFISVEAHPVGIEDMARAHSAWRELEDLAATLRAALPPPLEGFHYLDLANDVSLLLLVGEAGEMLRRVEAQVDAWFLDGFSPAKNPEMWRPSVCAEIARLSRRGSTFATFTVARSVVDNLTTAGFVTQKLRGAGKKRDMLAGAFEGASDEATVRSAWFARSKPIHRPDIFRLGIIGGGVAGAALAHAAQRAGLEPAIIDPEGLARGASGNAAGLIMPRLDLGPTPAAHFSRAAFVHAVRLLERFGQPIFNQCGVTLSAADKADLPKLRRLYEAELLPADWLSWTPQGLRFLRGGVVDPAAYVAALADGAQLLRQEALRIEHGGDALTIVCVDGARHEFSAVIIANSLAALSFSNVRSTPLSGSIGQIDWFPEAPASSSAIAWGPYLIPAPGGGAIIGATRAPIGDNVRTRVAALTNTEASASATEVNLAAMRRYDPTAAAVLEGKKTISRASLRCETPDRLPLVGPLPDWGFFGSAYDPLRYGRQIAYPPAEYQRGVFIAAGFGSRGLVTAPLCADMVIAELTGGPSPVPTEIAEALHPGRFFIRSLKRAQPTRQRT